MDDVFMSDGLQLSCHIAAPAQPQSAASPGVLLCHGFPVRGRESPASGKSFPELVERIAVEMEWTAMAMNFRGCGHSEGNFAVGGWVSDILAGVRHLRRRGVNDVWLAGFGTGGALTICAAAQDTEIRGVAAVSAPADFNDWARNPRQLLVHARRVGVVKDPAFPEDFDRWALELRDWAAIRHVAELADRPLLVIHGETDELVPSLDARLIADGHGSAELRILAGAGHELRHDPRAVAVLLGWLSRNQNARAINA
jgi:putative redox protein